jgi:hypothetical protein
MLVWSLDTSMLRFISVLVLLSSAQAFAYKFCATKLQLPTSRCQSVIPSSRGPFNFLREMRLPSKFEYHKSLVLMSLKSPENNKEEVEVQTHFPGADRIVAIGDVHGDFNALRRCLKIAGVCDEDERWTGGTTHLVQLGDILDRGDTERSCIDLLFSLKTQARASGGDVHILLGNHELMNVDRDFRYVTPNSWTGWTSGSDDDDQALSDLLFAERRHAEILSKFPMCRERAAAFLPGGHMARRLARMPVAVRIGDTLLVHAGVRLAYARYGLDKINEEAAAWLSGRGPRPKILDADDSPLWVRQYSVPNVRDSAERELEQVLRTVGAQRMVVGHTPQVGGSERERERERERESLVYTLSYILSVAHLHLSRALTHTHTRSCGGSTASRRRTGRRCGGATRACRRA